MARAGGGGYGALYGLVAVIRHEGVPRVLVHFASSEEKGRNPQTPLEKLLPARLSDARPV